MEILDSEVPSLTNHSQEIVAFNLPVDTPVESTEWFKNVFLSVCDCNEQMITMNEFKNAVSTDTKVYIRYMFVSISNF